MRAINGLGRCVGIVVLLLLHAMPARAQVITNGATERQVRETLGKPNGRMRTGNTTILSYDRGFITLVDGQVTKTNLVSDADARQAREQRKREAQVRRAGPESTPVQPVVKDTQSLPQSASTSNSAAGLYPATLKRKIADTEEMIATISSQPANTKQDKLLQDGAVEHLRLKLDVLNELLAEPAAGTK